MTASLFATPALWFPGQEEEETAFEIHRMLRRSLVTAAWERGEMSVADWLDAMDELGVDVMQAHSDWMQGIRYL